MKFFDVQVVRHFGKKRIKVFLTGPLMQ